MKLVNKPIEVAACLDSAGIIKPVSFKSINEDKSITLYNIKRCIRRDKEKSGKDTYIYTFTCEVIVDLKTVLCDLKYNVASNEWTLFRM